MGKRAEQHLVMTDATLGATFRGMVLASMMAIRAEVMSDPTRHPNAVATAEALAGTVERDRFAVLFAWEVLQNAAALGTVVKNGSLVDVSKLADGGTFENLLDTIIRERWDRISNVPVEEPGA